MKIGIDARLYGLEHAGLGRYVTELVHNILKTDNENTYVLFINKKHSTNFKNGKRLKVVTVDIPIYGFWEQIILPFIFAREKLDLLHIPHFNAPIFYPLKMVLTIHDLIKHESKGPKTTTRQPWLYFIKRVGYLFLAKIISFRAVHIFVPSEYVKQDIVNKLKTNPDKISVTYEAVSGSIKKVNLTQSQKTYLLKKYQLQQPFVVHTGSTYPHKNVESLIDAVILHNQNKEVDLQLVLIGSRPVFWERMKQTISQKKAQKWVKMLGFLPDEEVSKIYSLALALVHPSKMEGFGLPGLEALNVGLPVVSSNATCLPEIYGDAAYYFDPNSIQEIVSSLEKIISDSEFRKKQISKGLEQVKKYSWLKTAKLTIKGYNSLR